jgi:HK97 gp10 family phage protein
MMKSNVSDVLHHLDTAASRAMEACGLAMEGHAADIVPVDTGNLRNSITHASDEHTAIVGTNVEYAPYVELGTSRQKAQPYLVPSVRDHTDEYRDIISFYLSNS